MWLAAICVAIVFLVLASSEILWRQRMLRGEFLRKSVHISVAAFVAFWPWLISWNWIKLIGLAFIAGVIINRRFNIFHMLAGLRPSGTGDINFALVVIICALLTDVKIFFCLAILNLALADAAAALVGQRTSSEWRYKVLGQPKTVWGTMAFWLTSFIIIGIGAMFAHSQLSFDHYLIALLALPPFLTILENVSIYGLDNLTVPIAVVLALRLLT